MTPDAIKAALADVTATEARVRGENAQLTAGAGQRRDVINARLDELRPKVGHDEPSEAEYLRLVEERGRLDEVFRPES